MYRFFVQYAADRAAAAGTYMGAAAEAYGSHRAVHCIQLCGCCGFACIPDYADPAYNAGTDVEIGKELNL